MFLLVVVLEKLGENIIARHENLSNPPQVRDGARVERCGFGKTGVFFRLSVFITSGVVDVRTHTQ